MACNCNNALKNRHWKEKK